MKTDNHDELPVDHARRALRGIWPELDDHLSAEALSAVADRLHDQGGLSDVTGADLPEHLLLCDTCLEKLLLLLELLDLPPEPAPDGYHADLTFLTAPVIAAWHQVRDGLWEFAATIRIHVEHARVSLPSLTAPLRWASAPAAAARGLEAAEQAPGIPGELVIPLPDGRHALRLLLTGTARGVHVILLGIVDSLASAGTPAERQLSVSDVALVDAVQSKQRVPVQGPQGVLDLGVVRAGMYTLSLHFAGEQVHIPIEVR